MKVATRRILVPAGLILAISAILVFATLLVEDQGGQSTTERFRPFSNVHLLEEALEGSYNALHDLTFWSYSLFEAVLVFGVSSFIGAMGGTPAQRRLVLIPAVSFIAMRVLSYLVYASDEPRSMHIAFVAQQLAALIAAIAGIVLTSRMNRGRMSNLRWRGIAWASPSRRRRGNIFRWSTKGTGAVASTKSEKAVTRCGQ